MLKKIDLRGMGLYSLLFSITMLSGAVRFSGISLIDEMAFLLLIILLIIYQHKKVNNYEIHYVSKYYARAIISFNVLLFYLIFSLILGLVYDSYIGKLKLDY